jgi:transcriptional regulator with XRE-family HTH domain
MIKIDTVASGRKIKAQMATKGMTAEEVTEALGYSDRSTIYRWMRGETMPSYENLVNLTIIFQCKIKDLVAYISE